MSNSENHNSSINGAEVRRLERGFAACFRLFSDTQNTLMTHKNVWQKSNTACPLVFRSFGDNHIKIWPNIFFLLRILQRYPIAISFILMPGVGLTERRLPTAEIYWNKNRRNTYDQFPGTFSEISCPVSSGLYSVTTSAALRPWWYVDNPHIDS